MFDLFISLMRDVRCGDSPTSRELSHTTSNMPELLYFGLSPSPQQDARLREESALADRGGQGCRVKGDGWPRK